MEKKITLSACIILSFFFYFLQPGLRADPCQPCNYSNPNLTCSTQIENNKNCTVCLGKDDTPCENIACSPDCPELNKKRTHP